MDERIIKLSDWEIECLRELLEKGILETKLISDRRQYVKILEKLDLAKQ